MGHLGKETILVGHNLLGSEWWRRDRRGLRGSPSSPLRDVGGVGEAIRHNRLALSCHTGIQERDSQIEIKGVGGGLSVKRKG